MLPEAAAQPPKGDVDRGRRITVLALETDPISLGGAVDRVAQLARSGRGGYVCVSNVHMCMECVDDAEFARAVAAADLVVADGKPIHLMQRVLGARDAEQVRGADLTAAVLARAEADGLVVGAFGSSEVVLAALERTIRARHPRLILGPFISPPFRALGADENRAYLQTLAAAGVQILLVGLGCPKQERWMHEHAPASAAVMLGVGAVFDFLSGNKREAPRWMQRCSLEWLYRLASEPRRLWKRYLVHNSRFLLFAFLRLVVRRGGSPPMR